MGESARILAAHTPELFEAAVREAAAILRNGGLVALPTETVYGLAANAFDANAVEAIFHAKGRPSHNPIIVHVSDIGMARRCVRSWTPLAQRLANAFWPGPLTLVLEKSDLVPDLVTAGGKTVGIRWPAHPIMQAVIRSCGFPLAAPSANLSNRLSPTSAEHVFKQLGKMIPLIVDGGASNVGIESTVLDITGLRARILRPGMIHEPALLPIVGDLQPSSDGNGEELRSPGLLPKHYSPKARLQVWDWKQDEELMNRVRSSGLPFEQVAIVSHTRVPASHDFLRVSVVPRDPEAYSRALYAELHACDDAGAALIVVEKLPDGHEWSGLRDRLNRASNAG